MNIVQRFLRALPVLVFCLLLPSAISAQNSPVIYIENDTVVQGAEFALDIQVTDFPDILSNAFSLQWDTMVLRYVGVDNIALGMNEEDLNTMFVTGGRLGYLFFDINSSDPVSLDDETILFTVHLEAIGAPIQETLVGFTDSPVLQDAVDGDENVLTPTYIASTVLIDEPVSVFEPVVKDFVVSEAYPNPFSDRTTVTFELTQSQLVSWKLTDVAGKELLRKQETLNAGTSQLTLNKTDFAQPGTYILQVQAGQELINRRLFFIE